MNIYAFLLYAHILALVAGIFASTLAHFSTLRLERATTGPEAREWHGLVSRVSKVFPAAILTFVVTGSMMVARKWGWQYGFAETGAIAAVLLLVNGIIVAVRSRKVAAALAAAGDGPLPPAAIAAVHDPVIATLPWVNLMIVFGTIFVMTAKPTLAGSLLVLLIAIGAGLALAYRLSPSRKRAPALRGAADRA